MTMQGLRRLVRHGETWCEDRYYLGLDFFEVLRGTLLLPSLDGLTVIVGDGRTLKRVAKRLLPARGVAGKVFGGKLLVAFL